MNMILGDHEHTILVLQGGGALGAYQAGAYEGLAEAAVVPDWIAGVSIGAINTALIAGNPPERRVERLREFWGRMSARSPLMLPPELDGLRPLLNRISAASALMFGVPGFFAPRVPPPFLALDGAPGALSFYDTRPLKATLEELVDFDLLNDGRVRVSLGAVNLRNGDSVYFDSSTTRIGPEHVLASGALPPGFPPVEIDGELYWDGGIVSNTPLSYVLDEIRAPDRHRTEALILQFDLFSGAGKPPQNMAEVQERAKDIQYSSKQRLSTQRIIEIEALMGALRRVLEKLPEALRSDPDVQRLGVIRERKPLSLVRFINRHGTRSYDFKDYEFSRATVAELWQAGLGDVRHSVAAPGSHRVTDVGEGVRLFEMAQA